jgi:Holliday junction resolvase RusA-like endonuclease
MLIDNRNRLRKMQSRSLAFSIQIAPAGKDRPRFARMPSGGVRTYNTKKTQYAEQMIRAAWVDAGSVRLHDGPVSLTVVAYMQRPKIHFRASGALSAAGERVPLVEDALNGNAWTDDSQVVDLIVKKRWAFGDQPPHIKVVASNI